MKTFDLDKSILNNAHGLSCVENYLLFAMITENYDYKYLYYNSYLSFFDIACEFVENNAEYASFYRIPRLQEIAKKNNLVDINYYKNADFLENINLDNYTAIIVDSEYVKAKYNTKSWRNDHYILIFSKDAQTFYYLNDNPRDTGIIHLSELKKIYTGGYISFSLKNKISDELKKEFLNIFLSSIVAVQNYFKFDLKDIFQARDVLGIIRVLRKRIYEYCSIYISMDFYKDFIASLDRFYSVIEYMRIRNSIDLNKINQFFENTQKEDIDFMRKTKDKMEEYTHGIQRKII